MSILERPRLIGRTLLRRPLLFGAVLLMVGLLGGALFVRSARALISRVGLQPSGHEWVSVTGLPRLVDNHFAVAMNDGTKREWLFNPKTKNWERIKKIYAWMPLDEEVIPLTDVGGSTLKSDTWKAQLSSPQSGQILLGGGYTLTLGVHTRYSLTEKLGFESGGRWDPHGVIQKTPKVRWGGMRFIQTVRVVKETIHDEHGAEHETPLNLPEENCKWTAGSDLVTGEETVALLGSWSGTKFYSPNQATAIFKQIEQ